MDDNLVGYLLKSLEPEQHRELEKQLEQDPGARHKLDLLRQALAPLAADRDLPDPPAGLAYRTLARVAEYRCRPQPEPTKAPPTLPMHGERRWYRRADILIAASMLIMVGGVGVPALVKVRGDHQKTACEDNLRRFYGGLDTYCSTHGEEMPRIGDQAPYDRAGIFVPVLRESGALPADASIRCPGNGAARTTPYTLDQLKAMPPEQFDQAAKDLSGCYAYSLGYYDSEGQHRALRRGDTALNAGLIPVMADKPSVHGSERGNSPNHNGQNVLFMDGSVRFHSTPHAGIDGDHIYLNRNGKVRAGVNQWDTVLGCSEDKP